MAKIQLISCYVNIAGDRNNTVFRGKFEPVTFPEALVLQAIHGGQEHVHTMIDVGSVERDFAEEQARLTAIYGGVVADLFPAIAGRASLPAGDESIPSIEEVEAANDAASEAMASAKSKRKPVKKPATSDAVPPSLDALPN